MKEKLTKEDVGFAQIKNEILQSNELSLKAKGLFAYLYSKPDDWEFSGDRMVRENLDGRKSIYSALKELETLGYLQRNKRPDGKIDYYIKYSKEPDAQKGQEATEPVARNGKQPKRQTAETGSISNKESFTNTELTTKKDDTLLEKFEKDEIKKKTELFIIEVKEIMKGVLITKKQSDEIRSFVSYWTEPNKSKTKIRWEMQPTWDTKRRIGTWMRNQIKFGGAGKEGKYKATMVGVNK